MLFVAKMLKNVWVKMWVNCLTHIVTHIPNKLYPRKWTRDFDPWPRSADTHLTHKAEILALFSEEPGDGYTRSEQDIWG